MRPAIWKVSALALCVLMGSTTVTAADTDPRAGPAAPRSSTLDVAMKKFTGAISQSVGTIQNHPFYVDPDNQAAGMEYLSHMILRTLEEDIGLDPSFPYFRVMDFRTREGGDNPDQRYLYALINGGQKYRIWGRLGKDQARIEFQVYKGYPWFPGTDSRTVSTLSMKDLKIQADGSFEVFLSPTKMEGNWIENAPDATRVMIRETWSKWTDAEGGEVHIDLVGHEGDIKPKLTSEEMARRLETAAGNLAKVVPGYPDFVLNNYVSRIPVNSLPRIPLTAVDRGGPEGRWYSIGHFDLKPDEAILITAWSMGCGYQAVQLTDLWWSSMEYANRQSSLTEDQSYKSSDGAYYYVISARDPGIWNWLDTSGFRRGTHLMRYDCPGMTKFAPEKAPTARVIKLDDLRKYIPKDTPQVTALERQAGLAARRRHIQRRSGL